jgi:hypothetical protein
MFIVRSTDCKHIVSPCNVSDGQGDFFDTVPKADMASMEHLIFSFSTKPDTRVRKY